MPRPHRWILLLLLGAWAAPPISLGAECAREPETMDARATDPSNNQPLVLNRKPSDYLNRELPKWLNLSGEFRTRLEGRTAFGYQSSADDAYLLTRFRVNVEVHPTPWLRFFVQGQDARVGGMDPKRIGPIFQDTLDLRQAYLFLRNGEKGWLGLRVGRQELLFGVQRLVGPLDWTNTARSFDAVKLELLRDDWRVDIFASSVVSIDPHHFDKRRDGENLHGIYASLSKVVPHAVLEPYLLYKTAPRVTGERGERGDLDLYTMGFRLASKPGASALAGLDYTAEMARQSGRFAAGDISAWAGYGIVGYSPPGVSWSPRFSMEFSYASGDRDRRDGQAGTFDDLYPTNHLYYGLADLIGWRNIQNLRAGMEIKPHQKLRLVFDYHGFWLADRHDHLYHAGGGIAVRAPFGGALRKDIGRETDIAWFYTLSNQINIGAGFGHFFPGRFIQENSPGGATSFAYIFLGYKF